MGTGTGTSHRSNVNTIVRSNGSGYNTTLRLSDSVTNSSDISLTGSQVQLSVNGIASIYYNDSGNVGIGTTNPAANLHVAGSARFGAFNTQTRPASDTAGGVQVSWNYSSGNAETVFWNLYDAATVGFSFKQKTGANTHSDLYNAGKEQHTWYTADSERMRIDSSGYVGIGTSSPAYKLDVYSASGDVIVAARAASVGAAFSYLIGPNSTYAAFNAIKSMQGDTGAQHWYIGGNGVANTLTFQTNGANERMRIDSSGNVGIGTTNINYRLSLGTLITDNILALYDDGASKYGWGIRGGQKLDYVATGAVASWGHMATDGTFSERMHMTSAGNVGIGTSSPPQLLAVGNGTDQVGAGVSGAVSTLYFGAPSNSSGGIKRISYDRATGGLSFIGGSVASQSTQMTLDDSGNVGIATTSPDATLHVAGSALLGGLNSQTVPPSNAGGGMFLTWNFTNGDAETDLWNVFNNAPQSFVMKQKTGTSTYKNVYSAGTSNHIWYTDGSESMRVSLVNSIPKLVLLGSADFGASLWPSPSNSLTLAASITNGSPTLIVSSTANVVVGDTITAAGVPADTFVQAIVNGTTITMSRNATATASGTVQIGFDRWDMSSLVRANMFASRNVYIGKAAQGRSTWLNHVYGVGADYKEITSLMSLSDSGSTAALFGMRMSDQLAPDGHIPVTVSTQVYVDVANNNTDKTAWNLYNQAYLEAGTDGRLIQQENSVYSLWTPVYQHPYAINDLGHTTTLRLDAGIGSAVLGAQNISTFLEMVNNGARAGAGILFSHDALDVSGGRIAPAINLATTGQSVTWSKSTGDEVWRFFADATCDTLKELILTDTGAAISGAADKSRHVRYQTIRVDRFVAGLTNTGQDDYAIANFADDGSYLGIPFFIRRTTGYVGINTTAPGATLDIAGSLSFTSLKAATRTGLQYVTPQMYGAAGDGVTDDTAALTNALTSGYPVRLVGKFKITSAITINLAKGTNLKVEGAGQQLSRIILGTTSSHITVNIEYNLDNDVNGNAQVIMRDFTFIPAVNGIGAPTTASPPIGMLNLIATPVPVGGFAGVTPCNCILENVAFLQDETNGYAHVGIYLQDLRHSIFTDCAITDCIYDANVPRSDAAICFKTSNLDPYMNAPTGIYFNRLNIQGGSAYGVIFLPSGYTGAALAMDPQGVWFTDCIITGQTTNSINFITTDQRSAELTIRNCSFLAYNSYTVYVENMGNFRCDSNTISNKTNGVTLLEYNFNATGSHNGFLAGAHIMNNAFYGMGTNIAIGGTVNFYDGVTTGPVYVSYNGTANCTGGFPIGGTAVVASNNS